ncbi:CHAD domain-containing protein [Pseudomonas sp. TTU2014-080ASC]|uniref:CHAD domain-containing protein n=1 Tax=Pseudomonas sp. TTU2014-080ASC TaxID=1729724 RepID=UPI0007184903|nr:CHAD domain-containing protein [Pseudomonas sp. TTU2014-080ASC]KRW59824.1 hypothetical protein AO726_13610 [Pseudomonas sp. TTU2014-080ASC]
MSAIEVDVLKHVLSLQIRLYACRERLVAATDGEALHDLRIALRQLRSLLRPLRGLARCDELSEAAAQFGRLSGPVRDLEVLQAYLRKQGLSAAADVRLARLRTAYTGLIKSRQLSQLFSLLDQWPQAWRESGLEDHPEQVRQCVDKRIRKDSKRLYAALNDPAHDRHQLRLLVKRLRYALEAYAPEQAGHVGLKRAQSALGDWHDHLQWLSRAEVETDLQPCADTWQQAMYAAQTLADEALAQLATDRLFSRWHR